MLDGFRNIGSDGVSNSFVQGRQGMIRMSRLLGQRLEKVCKSMDLAVEDSLGSPISCLIPGCKHKSSPWTLRNEMALNLRKCDVAKAQRPFVDCLKKEVDDIKVRM